jgi:hypothetical protein
LPAPLPEPDPDPEPEPDPDAARWAGVFTRLDGMISTLEGR